MKLQKVRMMNNDNTITHFRFLVTSVGFWLVTLLLPYLGITFAFTWGKAFVVWAICKVFKLLMN